VAYFLQDVVIEPNVRFPGVEQNTVAIKGNDIDGFEDLVAIGRRILFFHIVIRVVFQMMTRKREFLVDSSTSVRDEIDP
jgi:hypothetical protein